MDIHYYFLVRAWKSLAYFDRCIDSLLGQEYHSFTIIYIDDASGHTSAQKAYIKKKLAGHSVVFNRTRQYSLKNAYRAIHTYVTKPNAVVVNVDGDDWLLRNDVLSVVDATYRKTQCLCTYGDCVYYAPGTAAHLRAASQLSPGVNTRYPQEIEQQSSYRLHPFRPLHLRTWRADLFMAIPKSNFLRPDGSWISHNEDQALYFAFLEAAQGRYEVLSAPLYAYNIANPQSDKALHLQAKLVDEVCLRKLNQ